MRLGILPFVGCIGLVACSPGADVSNTATNASVDVADEAADTPAPTPVSYTDDQRSMICRAGIAAEMGRDPKIMTAKIDDGLVRISYRRPTDKKLWKYDCKPDGNRIVWRTVDASPGAGPGVWRTRPDDDVLTFTIDGSAVTTNSSDGSSASETYQF